MVLPGIKRNIIKTEHLDHEWEGSVVDLLDSERVPFNERLRLVIDYELISDKLLRLFAVWCARRVLNFCPRPILEELLTKVEEFARGECSFEDVKVVQRKAKESSPTGEKSVQLQEAEAAAYATVNLFAKDAAKEASFHSLIVLSYYNDREEIQRKHFWKIQDLVLTYLTSGEVAFILRNHYPYALPDKNTSKT